MEIVVLFSGKEIIQVGVYSAQRIAWCSNQIIYFIVQIVFDILLQSFIAVRNAVGTFLNVFKIIEAT